MVQLIFSASTKVLVTTGSYKSKSVEIIDLEDPSFKCTKADNFPMLTRGANGALIGNMLMICGVRFG